MKKSFRERYNATIGGICIYVIVTALIIFLMMKFFNNFGTVLGAVRSGMRFLGKLLLPLGLGFVLAYLLYPIMKFLERRLYRLSWFRKKTGRSRSSAVAITVLATFLLLFLLFSVILSTITREIRMIHVDDLTHFVEAFVDTMQNFVENFGKWIEQQNISSKDVNQIMTTLTEWGRNFIQGLGNGILEWASKLPEIFTNLLFAVIFGIYFLLDGDGLRAYWDRVLKAISSRKVYRGFHIFLDDADRIFSGYIRGQLIDAILMDLMVSVAFSIVGVKFAILIGMLTGLGNLIPYVGPVVAYGSTILVCVMNGEWQKLVIALIVVFVIQTLDGNVINPKLLSSNVNVHPMLVIASLIIGGAVGGILGMLLAVPVAALLKTVFDRLINWIIEKRDAPLKQEIMEDQEAAAAAQKDDTYLAEEEQKTKEQRR